MAFPIIDLHAHSTLKPYGQSFYANEKPKDATSEACIWYSDPPSVLDEALENTLGFPAYRQSDFNSAVRGGVNVAVVSLYPIEEGFVKPTLLPAFADYTVDWITLFGRARVEKIKAKDFNYFKDLNTEYEYLKLLNGTVPTNGKSKYYVAASGSDLQQSLKEETLNIIVSIEGAHVLCDGNDVGNAQHWANVAANVRAIKLWDHPPFFITLNHHFFNSLASHAESLFVKVGGKNLFDQTEGMEQPIEGNHYISKRGEEVIDLLYQSDNGRRILIDIKHMAKGTRKEFYALRRRMSYGDVPIISSHSALFDFYQHPINLDKDDITEIYRSRGIIGIELDQRVLGYNDGEKGKRFFDWVRNALNGSTKSNHHWSAYFWKNIQAVAEHCYSLDSAGNPWSLICLGSDFDGIINPLNKFRTALDLQNLASALLNDVDSYWKSGKTVIPKNHLGMDAHDVVYQIMYTNALNFITKNY